MEITQTPAKTTTSLETDILKITSQDRGAWATEVLHIKPIEEENYRGINIKYSTHSNLSHMTYFATHDSSPFFCFSASTLPDIKNLAHKAVDSYVDYEKSLPGKRPFI